MEGTSSHRVHFIFADVIRVRFNIGQICKISSMTFNIVSTLLSHLLPIGWQIADSREGCLEVLGVLRVEKKRFAFCECIATGREKA